MREALDRMCRRVPESRQGGAGRVLAFSGPWQVLSQRLPKECLLFRRPRGQIREGDVRKRRAGEVSGSAAC